MAVRAMKVFEDLKLRSPARIMEWMEANIKRVTSAYGWLSEPVRLLKIKEVSVFEAVALIQLLFRVAGYTTMVYFIHNRGTNQHHPFLIYNTSGKWYWFEWYDMAGTGIHEYSSEEELLDGIRRFFIGRNTTYTDICKVNGELYSNYAEIHEVIERFSKLPQIEDRIANLSVFQATRENIRFFEPLFPKLKKTRTDKENKEDHAGYILYDATVGCVTGFIQYNIYTKIINALSFDLFYRQDDVIHSVLRRLAEINSVYHLEMFESDIEPYEESLREFGYTRVTHGETTGFYEYHGLYRKRPEVKKSSWW